MIIIVPPIPIPHVLDRPHIYLQNTAQLVALVDDKLSIPINQHTPFLSTVYAIASSDALLCSLQDGDTSDPATISKAC